MAAGFLVAGDDRTLVEQIVAHFSGRIANGTLRTGARLPSIRRLAQELEVSKFTVVEAYERLIAAGHVASRRGTGFFVRERAAGAPVAISPAAIRGASWAGSWADAPRSSIDLVWLLRNMFRELPAADMPGSGVLPSGFLDESLLASAVRTLARRNARAMLDYGQPQGYLPLREQLRIKLDEQGIGAASGQIVTTAGVTQALDLVAQCLLRPGDTVLVDDPSWFLMFGRFSQLGAQVIGVPRLPDGPDVDALRTLCERHRPRMFVTVSVVHNPTSTSMSAARAFQVLRLAQAYDMTIVEDDLLGDLHPGGSRHACIRLAALDQLDRVIYLGGFSKTLAANLRVGFIAASADRARELTDLKMLVTLTSPEFGERLAHQVLSEGHYRRHLERLRTRLDGARDETIRALEGLGLRLFAQPEAGMYLWADAGVDTAALAARMLDDGYLLAPGSLFLPDQRPSSWLRFNVATSRQPAMHRALAEALART